MTRTLPARLGVSMAGVALVVAGVVSAPTTEAAPTVGAIGPVTVVNGPGSVPGTLTTSPAVAVLPNGATTVAWTSNGSTKLHVRTRGPNSGSWGAIRTLTLPAGWTIEPGFFYGGRLDLVPLGTSRFLLAWRERSASGSRIRAARLTLSSPITPKTLSTQPVDSSADLLNVAVNPAGRAVVSWSISGPPIRSRFALLPTPTGSWSAPVDVAPSGGAVGARAAVSASGAVCFAWFKPTAVVNVVRLAARCRTAGSPTLRPIADLGRVTSPQPPLVFAITAVGEKFLVAVERPESGDAALGAPVPPTSVRVLELSGATSSTWALKAVFRQPNQVLAGPLFAVSSDGWVALTYTRIQSGIGGSLGMTDYTATRTPQGAWSTGSPVASYAGSNVVNAFRFVRHVAAGPGGEVVTTTVQPRFGTITGWVSVASVRSSASAAARPLQRLGGGAFVADVAVAPSGQATFVTMGKSGSTLQIAVQTTALAGGAS